LRQQRISIDLELDPHAASVCKEGLGFSPRRIFQLPLAKAVHQSKGLPALVSLAQQHQAAADAGVMRTGKRGEVQAAVRQLKGELAQEAAQLSVRRRAAAGTLRAAVEGCLADLAMAGSRFDVRIGWEEHAKVGSAN
jgi:DNA repair ATPase RecN